VNKV